MEIRRRRSRTLTAIIILFVLAVVVAAGTLGYFWYRKAHESTGTTSGNSGGTISLDATEKIDTETIQTALVIPKSTDKPGDAIKLSVLTMTVPKVWRTVNAKNLLNTSLDSVYAASANDILTQLVMVPEKNPADQVQTTNSLGLYNITSWLSKPTQGSGGTVTPAAKAAYMQNIKDIGAGNAANKTVCAKGYGVLNATLCGDLLRATSVTTKDGSLSGVIFLNTMAQSVSYDPQVLIFMTGQVKDQQLFAYGAFHLLDQNSHELNVNDTAGIKAAWDSFVKNVPSDTLQLYQHVIDAVKSITIQAN
jgi:hypothetical protein